MSTSRALSPELDALFAKLHTVATLPTLAVRIIESASRFDNSATELQDLIKHDPVLVARIMRVANGAYYSQSGKVDTIQRAITLLGNRRLANMALTIVVARQFSQRAGHSGINRLRLWKHSTSVAGLAKLLAEKLQCIDPERAYLAGLLHDFGMLMIDQLLAKHVPSILVALKTSPCPSDAVFTVLPFRPGELGAYVARKSNLPEAIAVAIECHHDPGEVCSDVALVDVIHCADYLANRHRASIFRGSTVVDPNQVASDRLGVNETLLRELWPRIERCLAEVQQFVIE